MSLQLDDYLGSIHYGISIVNTRFLPENVPGCECLDIKARLLVEPYFLLSE